eukprot:TRINITY_DN30099_c0_g1_i1.p1 TRINITY_DN30099_c0_g1~~TRINITY_DN30099_c0_g1_i1.p1  ORF type:complete len:359 (+),score=73.44 TRINITY_DN30099_c0_g1_i1:119-1195(+)
MIQGLSDLRQKASTEVWARPTVSEKVEGLKGLWPEPIVRFIVTHVLFIFHICHYVYYCIPKQIASVGTDAAKGAADIGQTVLKLNAIYFASFTISAYTTYAPCVKFGNFGRVVITLSLVQFPMKLWPVAVAAGNNTLSAIDWLVLAYSVVSLLYDMYSTRGVFCGSSRCTSIFLCFTYAYSAGMSVLTLRSNFSADTAVFSILIWLVQLYFVLFCIGPVNLLVYKLQKEAFLNLRKVFFIPFWSSRLHWWITQKLMCCLRCVLCTCCCPSDLMDTEMNELSEIAGSVKFNGNYYELFKDIYTNSLNLKGKDNAIVEGTHLAVLVETPHEDPQSIGVDTPPEHPAALPAERADEAVATE